MKEKRPQKRLLQFVTLSLLSLLAVVVMSGESHAALQCYNCHGDGVSDALPLDTPYAQPASYRNITTGAVKGNHQTHLSGLNITSTNQGMCARCHNNSGYTSSHRSGTITLNKAINSSPQPTSYSGSMTDQGTFLFKNQTSVPVLGTCSNVNCHFETVTPTWGSDPAATMNCGACHASSPSTGSHNTHLATGAHATYSCTNCHANRANFQHATSAGNAGRVIDLTGSSMTGATITRGNEQIMPSQAGTRTWDSCGTVYCHSSGQSANGASATPAFYNGGSGVKIWNDDNGTLTCASCHASVPTTGSHTKHFAFNNNCGQCHAGATASTMSSSTHVDGNINVNAAGVTYTEGVSSARGNGYGSCSASTCHANPVGTGSVASPTWGVLAANCTACHTGANQITAAGPANGSHTKHMAVAGTLCTDCHNAGTTATAWPTAGHLDGNIDVIGGYPTNKAKGSAYTTCATATCHANPVGAGSVVTPTWGVVAANCSACHTGTNQITAAGPANGSHTKHMAVAGTLCTDCHNAGTTATAMPTTGHLDGNIDVTQGYPTNKTKGSAYTTCATATCHANPLGAGSVVTPTWGVVAANCTACHTAGITALGPATGTHTKHMAKVGVTVACTDCHTAGTSATTVPSTGHADGNIDVTAGSYTANKTKGSAYTTCSNVSCHNGPASNPFTAPAILWGAAPSCTNCHGNPPANASHAGVAAATCNQCHSDVAANGTTISIPAQHLDGKVDGGKCNACHGYPPVESMTGLGKNSNYSTARLQNYSGGGGVHSVAGHLPLTLKTSQYTGTASFTPCLVCHPSSNHNEGFSAFSTHHVQVAVDTKFKFDKNRPIVYTSQKSADVANRGKCSNVECHFQKSPKWSTQTYTNR